MKPVQYNRLRIVLVLLTFTLATGLFAPLSRARRSESVETVSPVTAPPQGKLQPTDGSGFFTNSLPITIPDSGAASAYPVTINVTGLPGVTSKVRVILNRLTHTNPDDLDILLVSPTGQTHLLMSDAGGSADVTNLNVVLDDEEVGTVPLPDNGPIVPITYTTSNYAGGDTDIFPAPGPPPPYGDPTRFETLTTAFRLQNPNGLWQFFILDDKPGDSGSIANGITMRVETVTYEVTNLNPSGAGSLLEAINSAMPGDRIDIDPNLMGTITLTSEIVMNKNLTIRGPGEDKVTISGNNNSTVFVIEAGVNVTISNLTLANGRSLGAGGGIINQGTLALFNVTVANCRSVLEEGGGIYNTGNLNLGEVTVRDCQAGTLGGGIANLGQGLLNVFGCTFSNNNGGGAGGAIFNGSISPFPQRLDSSTFNNNGAEGGGAVYSNVGTISFVKDTFNNNGASDKGGALYLDGADATATNCTFYSNDANNGGAGAYSTAGSTLHLGNCTLTQNEVFTPTGNGPGLLQENGGTTTMKNVIAAQNLSPSLSSGDLFGSVTSQGGNLVGDGTGLTMTPQPSDQIGTSANPIDPKLTALGDYGGLTQTCMLEVGSPAINTAVSPSNRNNEDQRGLFAPQGSAEDRGSTEHKFRFDSKSDLFDIRLRDLDKVDFFASLKEDSPQAFPLNGESFTFLYGAAFYRAYTNQEGIARGSFQVILGDGQVQTIKAKFDSSPIHNFSINSRSFKYDGLFITRPNSAAPTGGECRYLIFDADGSFAANGGTGTINVRTFPQTCNWTATSNDPWIQITSGANGTGDGSVSYSVLSHSNPTPRAGSITVAGITYNVLQGAAFLDVTQSNQFYTEIGKLSARGVTLGIGGGNYGPTQPVTREQMAAFIIRALGDFNPPQPASQRFDDVPPTNFFYAFIEQMAVRGITLGCSANPPMYCPSANVTREQMAAFMIRALGEPSPTEPFEQRFTDVPLTNFFSAFIDRMAVRRITLGCSASPPMYCPSQSVTREQMAAFLVRAFGL